MPNPVVHFDIGCRDREKSDEFYSQLFGWKTTDYGPLSKKIDTESSDGIQGHITSLGHEPHNYVTIYVEVAELEEYLTKVVALGGEVMIPATEIPGGGHFAWIKDLDGNIIGLHKK